jgi:2-keto-4-pentenoate hydratase
MFAMLDDRTTREAAALLFNAWQSRSTLPQLPERCRPGSRAEGYAIQRAMLAISGRRLFGWKIAATSSAGQSHIGVEGPLAGMLHDTQVVPEGVPVPISASLMKVAELEFAFRMARPLPARDRPYTVQEVMAAVESLHPAIEVPDSRYDDFIRAGAAQLIAENACADRFILGAASPEQWRLLDLAAHTVAITLSDREPLTGIGRNVLGDPRIALTWIANELCAHGMALEAGQVITTGTCGIPVSVAPGVTIEADYGPIGRIAARFVS